MTSGNRYAHIIPQNSQNHEKKEQEAIPEEILELVEQRKKAG